MTHLPAYPVVAPFLAAAFLMAASRLPRRVTDSLAILTSSFTAGVCWLLMDRSSHGTIVYWFGAWRPHGGIALGISFVVDPLGAGLALLCALLATAAFVFSWWYFESVGTLFQVIMLVFEGAMVGFCLTGDLFNLFVFFELMSAAAYALTGLKIEDRSALEGAINFGVTNSVGAFGVLAGIALLYGRTGALNMAQIGNALAGRSPDSLVIVAFVLMTCGFLVKGAVVPFHFWLADAHAVAPTPVCVLFSGVMVELGLYAALRIYWTIFSGTLAVHAPAIRDVLLVAGAITSVLGAVMCFSQRHLKRLLAFSTISHMGDFLIGAALLTPAGLAGTAVFVVGHGLAKSALFMCSGILLFAHSSVDEIELRGKGRNLPVTGAIFALGGLALSGFPPSATIVGKELIEHAATGSGHPWIPVVLLFSSIFTGGAILRAAGRIFLGWGPDPGPEASGTPGKESKETRRENPVVPWAMVAPAVALVALALAAGILPRISEGAQVAAVRFEDRPAYAAIVLQSTHPALAAPAPQPESPLPFLKGLESAGLAVFVAALALWGGLLPSRLKQFVHCLLAPVLQFLRVVHSGHAGDYVLWVTIGMVVFWGALLWMMR